ncbi:MutS-related protein [Marinifilum sp.]|uniref:MutS-related protein n=1 Tax=Marinifilum sp. TaxID=2033137 RepID=UPI003BACAC51
MEFVTDNQTQKELELQGRYNRKSILSLFNKTKTIGGSRVLDDIFNQPLNDAKQINTRKEIISFYGQLNIHLPFDEDEFEKVENYLADSVANTKLASGINLWWTKYKSKLLLNDDYDDLREGVETTVEVFFRLKKLMTQLQTKSSGSLVEKKVIEFNSLLNQNYLDLDNWNNLRKPYRFSEVKKIDFLLRGQLKKVFRKLLDLIYEMDVYLAVAKVAVENNFVYAHAIDKEKKIIDIKGVYHPKLKNAVGNDVRIDSEQNVLFLTGANMAGKTTLMKSVSTALYLAHLGFPVAAKEMTFSVHDGLFTSINLPDNITQGYSHFYAEVLRVKKVATEIASGKQLIIIFDELFKGTNVKDAYDATVSLVDAFSNHKGSFVISTHLIEAGKALKTNNKLLFKKQPSFMEGGMPSYTYQLEDGLSDDRHGMFILRNEGILGI